jgi:hypothetical protein
MTTGLSPIRQAEGGPRRGYVPKNRRRAIPSAGLSLLDAFAEHLANCGDVAAAATRLGMKKRWGEAQLSKLRKGLGWQAR